VLHDEPEANRQTRTPSSRARCFSRLAGVVTISEWLRDRYLEDIDPPARAPAVVPPGVDIEALPRTASTLDAANIPIAARRSRLILYAGRLTAEKGADLFVAACTSALPSLPGWRAEVIGAAEHTVKSEETPFTSLLKAAAEPASIAMMGYRDHPDVMAAMARAAIVVIPSRANEPGGRVAIEAMACGAAVICSSAGALREVCGDAAVYVEAADPAAFAAQIRALGQDPRRLAAVAEAGRQRATRFDLPGIGRIVEALRARIIAEGAPRL
jgi:glycosyltransferase involved in cell wall biosynthesis